MSLLGPYQRILGNLEDLANDVLCNFPHEALMNTFSTYESAYWLERISHNFLIWSREFIWPFNHLFQHSSWPLERYLLFKKTDMYADYVIEMNNSTE